MPWHLLAQGYMFWEENHFRHRSLMILVSLMFWIQVRITLSSKTNYLLRPPLEHIRYPEDKGPPTSAVPASNQNTARRPSVTQNQSTPQSQGPPPSTPNINGRSMSPSVVPERTISPSGRPGPNGVIQQAFSSSAVTGKGNKAPVRPDRGDGDFNAQEDGYDMVSSESFGVRERTVSPDQQTRAKSPAETGVGSRAVSPSSNPGHAPPNIIGVSMGINGRSSPAVTGRASPITGRASPAVERPRPGGDSTAAHTNGFARPPSRTGNGSVGNVATDLLRDLKAKDVELDSVRRQMVWMKEALGKATRAGYVQMDREGSPDLADDGAKESKYAELALRFKQFRAQMQASWHNMLALIVIFIYISHRILWRSKPDRHRNVSPVLNA